MLNESLPSVFLDGRIVVKVGDITAEAVDAVVNAANSTLLGGGGVDGAIHRKGGKSILEECRKVRQTRYPDGLPAGEAVATGAGNLPAKYVVHTVGPVWNGGKRNEVEMLRNCYVRSLECASGLKCRTLAFPAISTGIYRFPKERAAEISSRAIADFLKHHAEIKQVVLVFFSEKDAQTFLSHQAF